MALLSAVALIAWRFGYPALQGQVFKAEVRVTEIAMVSPAQASVTVTSTGYVVPQVRSKVGAKITGRIVRVLVKEGEAVKAGQVLAELDANDQRSSMAAAGSRAAAAAARVATAAANLAEIARQVERNRVLVEKGALAKATLEDQELRRSSLEQQLHAAEAEARAAHADIGPLRVGLEDRTILAPIAGTIITKPVEVGELVGPQSTITELADFDSMLAETDVPEGRLHLIQPATPCEIVLDAYPGRRYRGEVAAIGKRVDRAKATIVVKVRFVDPMDGVLPDMSARTSFLSQPLSEAAVRQAPKRIVPAGSIVERNGQKFVFTIEDDAVRLAPITVGLPFGTGFELLEGPKPGTRVVAEPPERLADGQRIKEKGT